MKTDGKRQRASIGNEDGVREVRIPPTAPLWAAAAAVVGGKGGGRRRGMDERPHGAIRTSVMMGTGTKAGWEGDAEGGRFQRPGRRIPMESTQTAWLNPTPQGVPCLTDRGILGGQSDSTTNGMAEGKKTNYPTNRMGNGTGTERVRE